MTLLAVVFGIVVCVPLAWWVARLGDGSASRLSATAVSRDAAGVQALLDRGSTIAAIKLYRELSGVGLKEAKEAVEGLAAGRPLPLRIAPAAAPLADPAADMEIRRLVAAGELIGAIKRYRALTGAGLTDAKNAIERMVS